MKGKWWTRRAITLHVALGITAPGCMLLGTWQLSRALAGNSLSWAYTFEWPFFTGYAVFMWWTLLHEPDYAPGTISGDGKPEGDGKLTPGSTFEPPGFDPYDEADPELAAYNRYLATLHAEDSHGRR